MIIDEKWMHPPPPPYYRPPPPAFTETAASGSISRGGSALVKPTFSTLPAHLLLQIVYSTFPQRDGRYEGEGKIERQRRNLYWLETSLRLVNKALYTGKQSCMHILRSTYLPAYDSLIRSPYTSDPFSSSVLTTSSSSDAEPVHRELATLDLFIALLAHEDLLLDATSLHLPREEAYKDLFDMIQPRSRLEDLILEEGVKAGLVYTGPTPPAQALPSRDDGGDNLEAVVSARPEVTGMDIPSHTNPRPSSAGSSPQPSPPPTKHSFKPFSRSSLKPLPFDSLSVSFSPRRVALIYTPAVSAVSSNTLAEVSRGRDEKLEVCAKRLIDGLYEALVAGEV
ncbi:hypothetical protein F5878DRAFT_587323 [Lentinula raphanica]|uniref:Uncharacterized protein n=1 Tax=Lentinula raphanica TaxID=153919 RepID=A0AA38P458_9AGAR|nr:hypothetical protein F5878DRAFT_587323 [Lentinula raphanica]